MPSSITLKLAATSDSRLTVKIGVGPKHSGGTESNSMAISNATAGCADNEQILTVRVGPRQESIIVPCGRVAQTSFLGTFLQQHCELDLPERDPAFFRLLCAFYHEETQRQALLRRSSLRFERATSTERQAGRILHAHTYYMPRKNTYYMPRKKKVVRGRNPSHEVWGGAARA